MALQWGTWTRSCPLVAARSIELAVLRVRMERRLDEGSSVSDGRWDLLARQRQEWEPVGTEAPEDKFIELDTDGAPEDTVRRLLSEFYARLIIARG